MPFSITGALDDARNLLGHTLAIDAEQVCKGIQIRSDSHRPQMDDGHSLSLSAGVHHHAVYQKMREDALDGQIPTAVNKGGGMA